MLPINISFFTAYVLEWLYILRQTTAWSLRRYQNSTVKSKMFGENIGRKQMERQSAAGTRGSCVWTVYRKLSRVFHSALEGFCNLAVVPETSITRDRCRLFLSAACPESIKLSRAVNVLPRSAILTLTCVLNANISASSVNKDHVENSIAVYELLSVVFKNDPSKDSDVAWRFQWVGNLNVSVCFMFKISWR